MNGSLALVGSGEYLPAMSAFEKSLLDDGIKNGKAAHFIQIPTAAGRESQDSLNYWKNLGQQQAERIGVQPIFLPIYTRDDAFKQEHVDAIKNSALMYMSGGDPHHLAEVLIDTPVWDAIVEYWQSGASLSGIHLKNLLKCGMTRISGSRFKPGVGDFLSKRKFGIWADRTIAPALHPASDAPLCQFSRIAFQTGVSMRTSARWCGSPPDMYINALF